MRRILSPLASLLPLLVLAAPGEAYQLQVAGTSPGLNQGNIAPNTAVEVTFDQPVHRSTVPPAAANVHIGGMFSGSALISRRCAKAQLTVTHAAQIYTMASSVLLLTGKCEDVSDPARTRYVAPYFLKNNNQVLKFAGGSRLLVFRRARRDSIASRMERHRSFHRKLNSAGTATPPMHVGRPMSREGSFERKPRRGSHHHHRRRQVSRTFKGHSARLHHQKSGILCNALRKNKSHSSLSFMVEEDEATTNGADNGTGLGSRPHGRHSSTQLFAMAEHDGNPEDEDEDDEEDDEEEEEDEESDEEE